jgi:hypothetical protein
MAPLQAKSAGSTAAINENLIVIPLLKPATSLRELSVSGASTFPQAAAGFRLRPVPVLGFDQ